MQSGKVILQNIVRLPARDEHPGADYLCGKSGSHQAYIRYTQNTWNVQTEDDQYMKGVLNNKATIPVTRLTRLMWTLYRISPDLLIGLGKIYFKKMRTARVEE